MRFAGNFFSEWQGNDSHRTLLAAFVACAVGAYRMCSSSFAPGKLSHDATRRLIEFTASDSAERWCA